MQLFAIAGGAGPGDEDVLYFCGIFPILPLIVLFAGLGLYRNSVWAVCSAFLLAGMPYLVLLGMVAGYEPSPDGDVMADQAVGQQAFGLYSVMTAVAALSMVWVVGKRLLQPGSKHGEPLHAL